MRFFKKSLLVLSIFLFFLPVHISFLNRREASFPYDVKIFFKEAETDGFFQEKMSVDISIVHASSESNPFNCGNTEFSCYLLNFLYYIFVTGLNFLVALSAYLMDFFLKYSIASTSYSGVSFIQKGWEILRDITNLVFIFAILYQAFLLAFGNIQTVKKKILNIILVALTINFSLYMTFFFIDVSNILAHTLYNKMTVQEQSIDAAGSTAKTNSISVGITKKINPQQLILDQTWNEDNRPKGIILLLVVALINLTFLFSFIKLTFLFLGRTVGLWIASILSALAMSTLIIPKGQQIRYIGFDRWLKSTLKMSFMAPIYLFFLYIIIKFLEIKPNIDETGSSFFNSILQVVVYGAIIMTMINLSVTVTKLMSGDFAGEVSKRFSKAAGIALGAGLAIASGGSALLLRSTLGRGASVLLENMRGRTSSFNSKSGSVKNSPTGMGMGRGKFGLKYKAAKFGYKVLRKMESSSFDISKSKLAKGIKKLSASFGVQIPAQPKWAKIGGSGEGGFRAWKEKKMKEDEEFRRWLEEGDPYYAKKSKEDERDELQKQKNSEEDKIFHHEKEIRKIDEKTEELERDTSIKKEKIQQEESEIAKLEARKENEKDISERAKFNKQISEKKENIAQLRDEIQKNEKKKQELQKERRYHEKKVEQANDTIKELNEKIGELSDEISNLAKEVEKQGGVPLVNKYISETEKMQIARSGKVGKGAAVEAIGKAAVTYALASVGLTPFGGVAFAGLSYLFKKAKNLNMQKG